MKNEENIAVLAQPEYLKNGLQTFEKNVNKYLLERKGFHPIYHNYRGESKKSYPFSRTVALYKTAQMIKEESQEYDRLFIPSQNRLQVDPDKLDSEIIPYVHDVLPFTTEHTPTDNNFVHSLLTSFQALIFQEKYIRNIEKLDKVIAASQVTADDLKERTGFNGEVEVVYQGVDNLPEPEKYYRKNRDIDLIYVGTLHQRKNPELLRESFRKAQEKGFTVASVNYQEINLPGKTYTNVSDKKLADLLGRSRYYLHASFIEGFGRTPVEAQRYGCFPLALDTEINREILGTPGETFYTVETSEDVISEVENSIHGVEREKAQKNSERFKWSKTRKEIEKVLKE